MADSCKVQTSADTKTQQSGKKKNKPNKKAPSEDGSPSSPVTSASVSSAPSATSVPGGTAAGATPSDKSEHNKQKQGKAHGKPEQGQKVKEGQAPPKAPAGDGEAKSKAQLKAERRAKQEAQRAAKEAAKPGGGAGAAAAAGGASTAQPQSSAATAGKKDGQSDRTKASGGPGAAAAAAEGDKKVAKKSSKSATEKLTEEQLWLKREKNLQSKASKMDHSILQLGYQYFYHNIVGANARCLALLNTLKELIGKYTTPEGKELSRDLEKNFLTPCISFLNDCRPISTSMGNAIKHLKLHINNKLTNDMSDATAIKNLQEEIDNFIEGNLVKAAEAVAEFATSKIDDGDVILVYAASSLIAQVLKIAHKSGKRFRVIVVEGRPRTEGKSMLRFLVRCGIPCSYVYIGSASHAMNEATKVFLGASAMFSIGDMHSRCGNSMIAALAKANNIPVLVCCETYKFTEKVQLQSSDSHLHARSKDVLHIGHRPPVITDHEALGLRLQNSMYDVTLSRYITVLVTELGMLPCTSVPVVLRRQEDLSECDNL